MTCKKIVPGMLFAAALLALAGLSRAQAIDSVFKDFVRTGEYLLTVNGKPVPQAEIYRNERLPAYLILSPAFSSPVLLTPRTLEVETVALAKIVRQPDGTVALAADAETKPQGQFKVEGDKVMFAAEGRQASLGSNPPLLGLHNSAELKSHSPEYIVGASKYRPNASSLAALKKVSRPVKVKTFFGSWCPHCRANLPFLLRVEDEIRGSRIHFEYYGLPQHFTDEAQAKKYGIDGVPTAIVFVAGREVGRISSGEDWLSPEARLDAILSKLR